MTDATIQQLTGEVDDLTRKVNDLSNLMALFMVNGLSDAFDGSGNQTYGGGLMRLDRIGIQILAIDEAVGITWLRNNLSTLSQLSGNSYAQIKATTHLTSSILTLINGTPTGGQHVEFTMTASAYPNASLYLGGNSIMTALYESGAGYFAVLTVPFWLPVFTADKASPEDGQEWYRSDIFRPRIRSNGITGNLAVEIQSATAPAVGNNGTITTAGVSAARVAPAGAVTGVILAVGTTGGQMCTVVNESVAASTVTFAVAGTSNVADGVASVIAGLNARTFCWNSSTALWYPVK